MPEPSDAKHTPEPWEGFNDTDIFSKAGCINGAGEPSAHNDGWHIADFSSGNTHEPGGGLVCLSHAEQVANRDRAIACVNALAGHDPTKLSGVRQAIVELLSVFRNGRVVSSSELNDTYEARISITRINQIDAALAAFQKEAGR